MGQEIIICKTKNPLVRDGTSQRQRDLAPLHPRYARIDERNIADLLSFAQNYSNQLQYYNEHNQPDGDWQDFYSPHTPVVLANIATFDLSAAQQQLEDINVFIAGAASTREIIRSGLIDALFSQLFTCVITINQWLTNTTQTAKAQAHIKRLIIGNLRTYLALAVDSYQHYQSLAWLSHQEPDENTAPLFADCFDKPRIFREPLSTAWIDQTLLTKVTSSQHPTIASMLGNSDGSRSIFKLKKLREFSQLKSTLESLQGWLQTFLGSQLQLINAAPHYLFETLQHTNTLNDEILSEQATQSISHKPHLTLYLTFIRLYKHLQSQLNKQTGKHLDHYYQNILGFKPTGPQTDKVHLLFELAKPVEQHLLAKGTLFKAGFDKNGAPVSYQLTSETPLNKAKIANIDDIKAVYIEKYLSSGEPIFSADAVASIDGKGKPFATPEQSWRPFTQSQIVQNRLLPEDERNAEPATIGFAVSSPILDMREGVRKITLRLHLSTALVALTSEQIMLRLSTEKGWLEVDAQITITSTAVLEVSASLDSLAPAITKFDSEVINDRNYPVNAPILEIALKLLPQNQPSYAYQALKDLRIYSLELFVNANGLKQLSAQSDSGLLDANKPFQPFGARPALGSHFIIGSDEAFRKPLYSLEITGLWQDSPSDFDAHYWSYYNSPTQSYVKKLELAATLEKEALLAQDKLTSFDASVSKNLSEEQLTKLGASLPQESVAGASIDSESIPKIIMPQTFKVEINAQSLSASLELFNSNQWVKATNPVQLFSENNQTFKLNISGSSVANSQSFDAEISYPLFSPAPNLDPLKQFNNTSQQGFVRLSLSSPQDAFGHKRYSKVYAERVIAMTRQAEGTVEVPNEPYTPILQNLQLSYGAHAKLSFTDAAQSTRADNKDNYVSFYHLTPFGCAQPAENFNGDGVLNAPHLLPQFISQIPSVSSSTLSSTLSSASSSASDSASYSLEHNAGELYIGLSEVKPPQLVSLFFKVAEGSANPERNKEPVYWSILRSNQWQILDSKAVIKDTTQGLTTTGIISIVVPDVGKLNSTLLPQGKVWLRVSIVNFTDAVCHLQQISTQVAEASFVINNNNQQFLETPLPANTIAKLETKQSQIKTIKQPYTSVGGKVSESHQAFNRRVSERLRHKDRASTIWDFEHLVLAHFSDVYKAKCINHTTYLQPTDDNKLITSEFAPGFVTVIVIPNTQLHNAINPLQPKLALNRLDKIAEFLKMRATPFISNNLKVINPLFEIIQLDFKVQFVHGLDPAIYLDTLNQDLKRYLSPWAFASKQAQEIQFGGKIYRSTLVNFIEELPYVDFVVNVKMNVLEQLATHNSSEKHEIATQGQYDVDEATARSARSIFVSHSQHIIGVSEAVK